ncbi:MAG: aldehyde ferredoxin oxidoreductase family protein [Candidatus Bathyarchaeota archaeon]|jgi:aldehyde:ferredoxin oxidoreductase|nr:aldehyde ferredoxin oxidoreductase family protein [Candidatus Bathyarchaeota archaeon]
MGGYIGKLLRIDLSSGQIMDEKIPENVLRNFIGGRGLGVKILYDELKPGTDPLSPDNKIAILTGPVTGTPALESGRWCSVTKSPLTGTIHDSQSGGDFGPYLKFSGLDGVIFEGASEKPVYLRVDQGHAELKDASDLWGKDVFTTTDSLINGDRLIRVACIGPAGENLVKFASIMNEKHRAAGRGGHGAVLGSKKVKAIVVRGDTRPPIADMKALQAVNKKVTDKIHEMSTTADSLPTHGTAILVNDINEEGGYPTRNFQTGVQATADRTSGQTLSNTLLTDTMGCWGCIMKCGRVSKVPPWSSYSGVGEGPEYETIWAFGAQCGVDNLEAITKANYVCNELGVDTIELGNLIGLAMELYEKGYIEEELARGLDLKFGNPQALVELAWRVAYRSGLGDDIAEGGIKFSTKYNAPELFMGVRGQGLPAYDPRVFQGHGLGYATSNRGGCHLRAYMIAGEVVGEVTGEKIKLDPQETQGKPKWVTIFQDLYAVCDSFILCKFNTFAVGAEEFASTLSAVTGWQYTSEDIMRVGERIYNLERAFNIREGTHWQDEIPKRFLEEPLPEGPKKGQVFKLDEMLDEYYRIRGWIGGKPTKSKLRELGLDQAAEEVGV